MYNLKEHVWKVFFLLQVPYNLDRKRNNGKNKNYSNGDGPNRNSNDPVAIPKRYRRHEVKHNSKDDFDYEQFNKTKFCGLESQLPNNYCNAMLEVSQKLLTLLFLKFFQVFN